LINSHHSIKVADHVVRLNNEIIEEGYRFVSGNVIIFLHRYLDVQTSVKETANDPQPDFSSVLPTYESLVPFDSENKWIVTARVDVLNGNDQEHVQKGIDELLSIKDGFEGYFDFPILERRMLDTRVRL
jgi:mediator of RNA polymerase II transcription subunit 18, fungi type